MNTPQGSDTTAQAPKKGDISDTFTVKDHSATAPVLQNLVSKPVLKVLPSGYSPNALTLTGGCFALSSAVLVWLFADVMRAGDQLGIMLMMSSAIMLVIYAVFDQLDGMQARKLKRSSSFGDFLDHWVDALIANSLTVPIMLFIDIEPALICLMAVTAALAFWVHNWETRNVNRRDLPVVGGLESIWTALGIMSVTSIWGIDIWHSKVAGFNLYILVYWASWSALAWVVIKALYGSRERLIDYVGFVLVLAPMCGWLLLFAPALLESPKAWLGYTIFGITATFLTGNLMRHHWLKNDYIRYDLPFFGLGLLLCGVSFVAGSGSFIETAALIVGFLFSAGRLIHQGFDTYHRMTA